AGGDDERLADRAVALVAREEAVEHLLARLGQRRERVTHGERLVERREHVVEPGRLELLCRLLASAGAQAVDAGAACQLPDPWTDRAVVAEPVQLFVDLREDVLEGIFRVGGRKT